VNGDDEAGCGKMYCLAKGILTLEKGTEVTPCRFRLDKIGLELELICQEPHDARPQFASSGCLTLLTYTGMLLATRLLLEPWKRVAKRRIT
jgi:hypothetical protein